jgi:hypothetical protein
MQCRHYVIRFLLMLVFMAPLVSAIAAVAAAPPAGAGAAAEDFGRLSRQAAQGDAAAQYSLGNMYLDGKGVGKDEAQAIAWWKKAAESGNADAQFSLGYVFSDGVIDLHLQRDRAKAQYWWTKAAQGLRGKAEQGDLLAVDKLAYMYAYGQGVHMDPVLADVLLHIANSQKGENWTGGDKRLLEHVLRRMGPGQKARAQAFMATWKFATPLPADMRGAVCSDSRYKQEKFDANSLPVKEFQDFQGRLRNDIDAFANGEINAADRHEDDIAGSRMALLRKSFSDTIDTGHKGEAFLKMLAAPPETRIVDPLAAMMKNIANTACAVGFGGTFTDSGRQVELWYVDLDPYDGANTEAFKKPGLPAYGQLRRDVFPALVLVRDEKRRLKLYGLSREMATVMNYWFQIQIQ